MSNWIDIDPKSLPLGNEDQKERDGITIVIGLSPYDIPRKLRGTMCDPSTFKIDFKYLTKEPKEPTKKGDASGAVTPIIGEHSGRLYSLEVSVHEIPGEKIALQLLVPAFEKLETRSHLPRQNKHYEAVREAITSNSSKLFVAN